MSQRERIQAVLEDLASQPHSPDRERHIRVLRAIFEEIRLLEMRIIEQDPATIAAYVIRPMADVEREHVLRAVRKTGSVQLAAEALDMGPATVYRHLARSSTSELEGIKYRGARAGACLQQRSA